MASIQWFDVFSRDVMRIKCVADNAEQMTEATHHGHSSFEHIIIAASCRCSRIWHCCCCRRRSSRCHARSSASSAMIFGEWARSELVALKSRIRIICQSLPCSPHVAVSCSRGTLLSVTEKNKRAKDDGRRKGHNLHSTIETFKHAPCPLVCVNAKKLNASNSACLT